MLEICWQKGFNKFNFHIILKKITRVKSGPRGGHRRIGLLMSAARPIQCCRRDSRQEMPLHHGANVAELHLAPLQNHPYLLVAEALSTRL